MSLSKYFENLPSVDEFLSTMETVGNLAKRLYPDVTFDTAMPQYWVDTMQRDYHFDPRGQVVWGYPNGSIFGIPLPLTREALTFLTEKVMIDYTLIR